MYVVVTVHYIPGMEESDLPCPLFIHEIHDFLQKKTKKKNQTEKTQTNRGALVLSGAQSRNRRHRVTERLRCSRLKHVQDGVVHLDEHGQVDREAGLAVLGGRGTRQPRQGVVLFQYKPEHIGGGLGV